MTHKPDSLREAVATSRVVAPADVVALVRENRTEKGEVLAAARLAGIQAAKRTWDLLPLCHPLPLTGAEVELTLSERAVEIRTRVRAVAPTGVEMEALTAASVAALTVYDMLKPHTKELEIGPTRLLSKTGGKSDDARRREPAPRALVVVASDSVSRGEKPDRAGAAVAELLRGHGVAVEDVAVLPDDAEALREAAREGIDDGVDLILTVGGTGLGPRDVTAEALAPLVERALPGVMEAARAHGQRRNRRAMLSRGVAGVAGSTILVALPGSTRGAVESCDALFPPLLHALDAMRGLPHGDDER